MSGMNAPRKLHPLADELRHFRRAAGLSLEALAKLTGVPAVVIGSYERGDRQPSLFTLDRLFAALGQEIAIRPAGSAETGYARTPAQMVLDLHAIAAQLELIVDTTRAEEATAA